METAKDIHLQDADLIICSPYTRALQTAAILSKELQIDIAVETDLHEWVANKNYIYEDDTVAEKSYISYEVNDGIYPDGKEETWESSDIMKCRVIRTLEKYKHYKKVIVACHRMMIQATAGEKHHLKNGEIIEFEL